MKELCQLWLFQVCRCMHLNIVYFHTTSGDLGVKYFFLTSGLKWLAYSFDPMTSYKPLFLRLHFSCSIRLQESLSRKCCIKKIAAFFSDSKAWVSQAHMLNHSGAWQISLLALSVHVSVHSQTCFAIYFDLEPYVGIKGKSSFPSTSRAGVLSVKLQSCVQLTWILLYGTMVINGKGSQK